MILPRTVTRAARLPAAATAIAPVDMPKVFHGMDDKGVSIGTNVALWKAVAAGERSADGKPLWYKKGIEYWDAVPATDDGVLGGYGHVSEQDAKDNTAFLKSTMADALKEKENGTKKLVACDCGAGIGRVTSSFLIHNFDEVDLVEPVKHFIRKAEELLSGQSAPTRYNGHKAVNFFAEPLESFTPEAGRYDVIWVQWCVGHLTDDDFEAFFRRCAIGLKPGGMIYVKENNVKDGFVLDTDDSSLTRSHKYFTHLFEDRCGFEIVKHKLQTKFPQELFQVRMYAVRPRPAT